MVEQAGKDLIERENAITNDPARFCAHLETTTDVCIIKSNKLLIVLQLHPRSSNLLEKASRP